MSDCLMNLAWTSSNCTATSRRSLCRIGGRPVMKAFRVGPTGLEPVFRYLRTCEAISYTPQLVLFDAYAEDNMVVLDRL